MVRVVGGTRRLPHLCQRRSDARFRQLRAYQ
jgi:hypothetical protein